MGEVSFKLIATKIVYPRSPRILEQRVGCKHSYTHPRIVLRWYVYPGNPRILGQGRSSADIPSPSILGFPGYWDKG